MGQFENRGLRRRALFVPELAVAEPSGRVSTALRYIILLSSIVGTGYFHIRRSRPRAAALFWGWLITLDLFV